MSAHVEQVSSVPRAKVLKAQAAIWLARASAGNWSEDDQAQLEAWLAESHAHRAAYWRVEAAWFEAAKLSVLQPAKRMREDSGGRRPIAWTKIAVAAIVTGFLAVASTNYLLASNVQHFATQVGGHRSVALADGSKIELNTDTALRISDSNGQRKIWLDKGEAFFQIKHYTAHPLIVMVGDNRIIDLGTKFAVRRDAERTEVWLVEGRAEFERVGTSSARHSAVLAPGDVLIAAAHSVTVTKNPVRELDNRLAWRHGVLVFFHTPLADAAQEINRYNTQKIVIADTDAGQLQINGTFPANDARLFGKVVHVVLGVNVVNRDDETVISR
jgi:transmembrane sensor